VGGGGGKEQGKFCFFCWVGGGKNPLRGHGQGEGDGGRNRLCRGQSSLRKSKKTQRDKKPKGKRSKPGTIRQKSFESQYRYCPSLSLLLLGSDSSRFDRTTTGGGRGLVTSRERNIGRRGRE